MRLMVFSPAEKGGKTTVALHLSLALLAEGQRVALMDLDPRGGLTAAISGLSDGAAADDLPALLSGSEASFAGEGDDWLILDPAPGWTPDLSARLRQADLILCPVQPEPESLTALDELTARLAAEAIDKSRLRLLVTRYSNRLERHRELRGRLTTAFGSAHVLPVVIRASSRLAEISTSGQALRSIAPRSTAASDFAQLARALMAMRSLSRPKGP